MERRNLLGVLGTVAGMTILPESTSSAQQKSLAAREEPRVGVTGIGGFFFRAKDPKALAQWYQDHLGVLITPEKPEIRFGRSSLDRRASRRFLRREVLVSTLTTMPASHGRFAHLHDPEGNGIELWQSV